MLIDSGNASLVPLLLLMLLLLITSLMQSLRIFALIIESIYVFLPITIYNFTGTEIDCQVH